MVNLFGRGWEPIKGDPFSPNFILHLSLATTYLEVSNPSILL